MPVAAALRVPFLATLGFLTCAALASPLQFLVSVASAAPPASGDGSVAGGTPAEGKGKGKLASLQDALATELDRWQGVEQVSPEIRANLQTLQGGLPQAPFNPNQPANVRANDLTGDLANEGQTEVSIAAWNQYVVVSWLDGQNLFTTLKAVGFAYSCDYGQTFTDGGAVPELDPADMYWRCVVAADDQGNFYLAANYGPSGFTEDAHAVWQGTWNGCAFTWGAPVLATVIDAGAVAAGDYLVRPRLAVSPNGPIFLAYTYFTAPGPSRVEVVASYDQGATWQAPVEVSFGGSSLYNTHPDIAVGWDGIPYVAWDTDYRGHFWCDLSGVNNPCQVEFAQGLDILGLTWNPPVPVAIHRINRLMTGPGDLRGWDYSTVSIAAGFPGIVALAWHEYADWTAPVQSGNPPVAEAEPNETPAQALVIPPGDQATGAMTALNQRDYWKVDLTAGNNYIVRLDPGGFVCGSTPTTNSFGMTLYAAPLDPNINPPDTVLARSFTNQYVDQIVFTAHRTGTYYLRVVQTGGVPTTYTMRTGLVSFTGVGAANPARDFSDIVMVTSTDGGSFWSNKVLVNSDAPVGYFEAYPFLSVDATNTIRAFWYDRRQSQSGQGTGQVTDLYMGPGAGQRITDESTTNSGPYRSNYSPGEYQGAASDGQHVFVGWGDQRGSNQTTSHYDAYTQFLDFEAPTTVFETAPAESAYLTATSVPFEWIGTDRNPLNTSLEYSTQLDGGGFGTFGSDTTSTLMLAEGWHSFRVRARDAQGNVEATASRTFAIDLSDPSVVITSGPAEGEAYLGSLVSFTWDGTDALTPDVDLEYSTRLDSGEFSAFSSSTSVSLFIDTGGPHTFEVQVRDGAGRTASVIRNFTSEPAVRWNSPSNGNWNTASNWDLGQVPTSSDVVVIDIPSVTGTITVNTSGMAASRLICRENLTVSAGSLSLGSDSEISGTLNLSGTSTVLSVTGNLLLSSLQWGGGTMSGAGTTTLAAGSHTFSTATKTLSGRTLRNDGTVSWTVGSISLTNGALVNNYGSLTSLHTLGNLSISTGTGGGSLNNYGTITKSGSASRFLSFAGTLVFENAETLRVSSGTMNIAGSFLNSGVLDVEAGGDAEILGTFSNLSGTTLTGGVYNLRGILGVPGHIETNAASITLIEINSLIADNSTSTDALENFSLNAAGGSFTLRGNQSVVLPNGGLTNHGTVIIENGTSLQLTGDYVQTAGTTIVDGTLYANYVNIQADTLAGSGNVSAYVENTGTVSPGTSPGTMTMAEYLQLAGGHLHIEIGGVQVGDFDQLSSTTGATLAGTLDVSLVNGFTPVAGQTFSVLNYVVHSGDFSTFNLPALPNGLIWQTQPGATEYLLAVAEADTIPPSITITEGPGEGELVIGSSVTFAWTASDLVTPRNSLLFAYRVDDDAFTSFASDTTAILNGLTIGGHTFEVQAKDEQGNIGSIVRSFSFDTVVRWNVDASGEWRNGANWSTGSVPTASDSVVIDRPGGPFTITVASNNAFARALSCAENLTVSSTGGQVSLTLGDDSSVSGTLTLAGGRTIITGDLTISGSLVWAGGNMEGAGTTILLPGTTSTFPTLTGSVRWLQGRTLRNQGTLNWLDEGFYLSDGAVFDNQGTVDLAMNTPAFFSRFAGTGSVTNAGTLQKSGSGTFTINTGVNFTSTGLLDLDAGTLVFKTFADLSGGTLDVASAATVQITSGGLTLGTSSNVDGEVVVSPDGMLRFTSGTHQLNASSSLISQGSVQGTGGSVSVSGNLDVSSLTLTPPGGSFSVSHSDTIPTLTVSGGTLSVTGDLTVTGSANWSGGMMTGSGTTFLASGTTNGFPEGGAKELLARTLQNQGTTTWSGLGDLYLTDGAVLVNSGILVANSNGPPLAMWTTSGVGTFSNNGTLQTIGTGILNITSGVSVTNSGTFEVANGQLQIDGPFTNFSSGTLSGGTYVIQGILRFQDAAIQTNESTIVLGGSSQIVDQNAADALAALVANGSSGSLTLTGSRDLTTGAGPLSTPLSNAGTVSIGTGSVLSSPGYVQSAGTTTVEEGGTLEGSQIGVDIQGGSLAGNGTVTGDLANAGIVSPGLSTGTLTQSGGAYTQSSSGHLSLEIGGTQFADLDHLVLSGNAALAGNLDASLVNGFTPAEGDTFSVIQYAGSTGAFDQLNLPALPGGLGWETIQGANEFLLVATELDTTPPVLAFTLGPAEGQAVLGSVTFAWSATDDISPSFALEYAYRFDGNPFTSWSADTTVTDASLPIGAHTFEVQVRDEANNVASLTRNFTVDVAVRWNVDASGDWNTGSNWNTGTVPTSADSVVIDRLAGFFAITVSSAANARALTCAESLAVIAGTLTLDDDSQVSGSLAVAGTSTLQVTGDLMVTGLLNWSGGTMRGSGTTVLVSGSTGWITSTSSKTLRERSLRNDGILTWSGGALNLRDGAALENAGTMIENSAAATTLRRTSGTTGAASFTNSGTFRKTGTGTTALGVNGDIDVTNSGTMRAEALNALSFRGATTNVTGTVELDGGYVTFQAGVHTFTPTSILRGKQPVVNQAIVLGSGLPQKTTVSIAGELDIKFLWLAENVNCFLAHGDTIPHVQIAQGDSFSVAGDLLVSEDLDWYGGVINTTGTVFVGSTGYLLMDTLGPRNLATGTLRSEGPIIWTLGETILESGTTFENLDSLTVDSYYDYYPLYFPSMSGGGVFRNLGVIHSPSTRTVTLASGLTENFGKIDFDAGTLSLGGTLSSGGRIDATGASVRLAGGTQTFAPGSSIVGDSLSVTGADAVISNQFDFNWASVDSGSLVLDHADTLSQLRVRGGTLGVNGDLRVGSLTWNGGEMTGPGTTILAPGPHTFSDSTGTVRLLSGRTLRNEGTLTWTSNTTRVESGGILENTGLVEYNGAGSDSLISIVGPGTFTNNGTLRTTGTGELYLGGALPASGALTATNADTFEVVSGALKVDNLSNYSVDFNTLTGGVYKVQGILVIGDADIVTNAASITLDGPSSEIQDRNGANAIQNLSTNNSAGSMTLANSKSVTTSGAFTNQGSVTIGTGCTLGMDGNYEQTAGTTSIDTGGTLDPNDTALFTGGTLTGSGAVAGELNNAAAVSPGASPGTLSVSAYIQQSGGALDIQVGGNATSAFDRLVATGATTLAGTLNVSLIDGFTPSLGDTFPFLPYASRTGMFDQVSVPVFSDNVTFDLVHTPNATVLVAAEQDTVPPNTMFVAAPANGAWVADDSVAVSWTGTDDHSPVGSLTYATQLDSQPASPYSASTNLFLTGLAIGLHTFSVTAKDRVGNVDPTPAQIAFYVDVSAPETDFTQSPLEQSVTDTSVASFAWAGTDDQSPADSLRFARSLDGAPYSTFDALTSTGLSGLVEGSHTYTVKSRDLAGNEDPTPVMRQWKVDLNPPVVTFVTAPDAGSHVASTSVAIAWTASDAIAPRDSLRFATSLDSTPFSSFSEDSTATLDLAEGLHTFSVQARDQVGRVGSASRSFTVDVTRPTVALIQGPGNGGFSMNSVNFGWSGADNLTPNGSLVFSYRLDLQPFSPFASALSVGLSDLDPGPHTFEVKVQDLAGNESQASASVAFTVDTIAPETQIVSGPVEGSTEDSSAVALSWIGLDDLSPTDSLRYAFRLDAGSFGVFSTATATTVTGLSDGPHTVQVKSRDLAGNEDSSPASRSFIADVSAPVVTITDGPAENAYLVVADTAFTWTATDAVSPPESLQFAYKLDGLLSSWSTTPQASLSTLSEGSHTFEARARDLVGRIGTQSRSFVVDLTAPTVQAPTARTEDGFKVRFTFTGFDNLALAGFETEIASDPSFSTVLLDSTIQGGSGVQLLFQGAPGNLYYARARARDRAGHLSQVSLVSNGAAIGNLPDLTLTDVQVPPTASSGQSFQVSWTVSNVGTAGTNVPEWFDRIYLSPTSTFNVGTATVLGTVQNLTFLGSDDSYTNEQVFTLPQGISGTQYVFVAADYQNQQSETDGNNNLLYDSVLIDLSSYADLVPTGIVDIGPTVFSGTQVAAIWTIKNNGTGRTNVDNWYDTVFLSPDGTLDYTLPGPGQVKFLDQPLGRLQHVGALDPESTYTATLNVTLPPEIDGTYHLYVWSDISVTQTGQTVGEMGNVFENVSELNNAVGDSFDVVLTPPADLTVSTLTAPTVGASGLSLALSWTVRNTGLNPTFESFWSDRVYMSTDNVLDGGDQVVLTLGHSGVLARDAEYTAAGSITLDASLIGSRWFFVTTDYDGRAYELDDTNNNSLGSETVVTLSPSPDLIVAEQTVESAANAGDQLTISWRVENAGAGAVSGSWRERIYLSTNSTLDPGSATILHTANVNASTSELRTVTVTLSTSLGGDYYIHVVTDADNAVFENTLDGNNTGTASPLTITAYPTVDLAVSNLVGPATLYSGTTYDVQWTVTNVNVGSTPSPNTWGEDLYLSTDAFYSTGDLRVAGFTHSGQLAAGASYTTSVSFPVSNGFAGQYYLLARLTPSAVRDTNTANDVVVAGTASDFILTPPPDLTVSSLTVPASLVAGQPLMLVWTVSNQGSGVPVPDSWDIGAYLSVDPLLSAEDVFLGSKPGSGALAASSSAQDSIEVSLPNYASGAYYVLLWADSQKEVYEAGLEDNNTLYQPITALLPSASDLRVTAVIAPSSASPADNVTVTWTIENIGSNTAQGRIQDAVYVSHDGLFNSIEDPLVGILERDINLSPGASLQMTKSVRLDEAYTADLQGNILEELPGVTPGQYYFLVRTDIRESLLEVDSSNNLGVSAATTDVTVPELAIGSSVNASIAAGQSRYYRIDAPAGLDLTVKVKSDQGDATNEIFLAQGRVPNLDDFDLAGPAEFTAGPSILVPSTQAGVYYVLVRALALPLGVSLENLTISAKALPFSLTDVTPGYGGTRGHVTCALHGAGLRDTTQVYLGFSGVLTPADRVTFVNTTELEVRWDLSEVPAGVYDVVASNGTEGSVTLEQAFRVEAATEPQIETTAIHPDVIRDNSVAYFTFRYRNAANWDAPHLQARIFYPADAELISITSSPELKKRSDLFPATATPIQGDFYTAQDTTIGSNLEVVDLLASNVPPGEMVTCTLGLRSFPGNPFSVRTLTEVMETETFIARQSVVIEFARNALLLAPEGVPADVLALAGDPDAFRDTALEHTYVDAGLLESADITQFAILASSGAMASLIGVEGAQGGPRLGILAEDDSCGAPLPTPECVPDQGPLKSVLTDCVICFQSVVPVTLRFPTEVTASVALGLCENLTGSLSADARVVSPCDPNQITGPAGVGVPRWVASKALIPYTVDFENLSEVASAPAQVVRVDVPLDADLNLSRFRLGNIGFGTHVVQVPPNSSSFTDEQFYADLGLRVRIVAGVDINNRKAFWTFQSIDPVTGLPPTNPFVGFLPVNDPFGRGQGFVGYSMEPGTAVATGTQLSAQANIVFDLNPPLQTNTTMNTVDTGLPTSNLQAPTQVDLTTFRIQWTASDAAGGSGLGSVALYVKQDNGPFTLFQSGLTGSSVLFDAIAGHVYGFHTRASDQSGNVEPPKTVSEVEVSVGVQGGVDDSPEKPLFRLLQNIPNPFASRTAIGFALAKQGPVDLRVYDLSGRLVATLIEGKVLPAGPHQVPFDGKGLGAGIYFYRLQAGKNVTARKMVLIQ